MPNKHIISKYLGKVKIDEIFQHQNNDLTKGPDGINIRGNMYIDDNLGIHKMINGSKQCISLHIYSPPF